MACRFAGAHAAVRANRSRKRQEAAEQKSKNSAFLDRLFDTYDTNKSGKLEKSQLRTFLADLQEGVQPTDEELNWVLVTADRSDGQLDNAVDRNELKVAIDAWKSYKQNHEEIVTVFDKYDTDKSGNLDINQLQALLTDLNDGEAPSLEEAAWVLKSADIAGNGAINRTELMYAIAVWYSLEDQKHGDNKGGKDKDGGCCVQ